MRVKPTIGLVCGLLIALFGVFSSVYFFTTKDVPAYDSLELREGPVLQLLVDKTEGKYPCFCGVIVLFDPDRKAYYYNHEGGDIEAVFDRLRRAKGKTVGVRFDPASAADSQHRTEYQVYEVLVDGKVVQPYSEVAENWRSTGVRWSWIGLAFVLAGLLCISADVRQQRNGSDWSFPEPQQRTSSDLWSRFWKRSRLEKVFGPWSRWDSGSD
jgi:hypothetical protein